MYRQRERCSYTDTSQRSWRGHQKLEEPSEVGRGKEGFSLRAFGGSVTLLTPRF